MSESGISGNIFYFPTESGVSSAPPTEVLSPEARIVQRICDGEEQAFTEFYCLYAPMVHGIVLARVGYDDVQDIVQEVFISAHKNLHTLRDRNAVGAWLAMIARNRVAEFYRRRKQTEELSDNVTSEDAPATEAAEANEILAAIRSLSETYRETLVLRLVEGMTGPEIAARTGLTPESVRVNLHRGMKLLREKLGITKSGDG